MSESVEQLGGPVRMGDPDLRDDAGEGDGSGIHNRRTRDRGRGRADVDDDLPPGSSLTLM
ncbi:MAG: hypothetical protein ACK4RZ_07045 [Paracoccaceae bacterium]